MSNRILTESSLYNGISQQNAELRLESQCSDAVNTKLSVAHGIEKRPSASLLTEDTGAFALDVKIHPIDIDYRNRYLLCISDGSKASIAYGTDGLKYPVIYNDNDVVDYIQAVDDYGRFNPDRDLRLTTVLSTTVITNRNRKVAMNATLTPALPTDKYIWFKNGVQQVERGYNINGTGLTSAKSTDNDTNVLVNEFVSWANGLSGFGCTKISNAIAKVTKDDGGAFTMTSTDSYSDSTTAITPVEGVAFEDLTPKATDNEIVRIVSEANDEANYYLQFDSASNSWSETVGPEISTGFDDTTMPHQVTLEFDADGSVTGTIGQLYFLIARITYAERVTGDDESSPNPSFIDKTINDIFFYKNRLGFLTTESVVCSTIDDVYNFWPQTVKEVLDDDPIDLSVSTTKSVRLEFASPFPDSMAIMGNNQQYSLHSDGKPFTSANATIDTTTAYDISDTAKPATIGASVYMSVPLDSYSALREYSVVPDSLVTDAVDTTGHVPRLLPESIKQIIPENNLEYVFLVDKEDVEEKNTLWVYKFYWQGQEKIQSSWSKWDLWFKPLGGHVFSGVLYLVGTENKDGVENTVVVEIGLETKSVELENSIGDPYVNPEPLIDRLLLSNDYDVFPDGVTAIVRVTQEQWDAISIAGANFVLVDRESGVYGDYIERFQIGNDLYVRFALSVINRGSVWDYANNFLIGQYKIGGV